MIRTYLDWAASSQPSKAILDAAANCAASAYANPSSRHEDGKTASASLEASRAGFARILSCDAKQVVFTSGGSESDSIPLLSLLLYPKPGSVVISATEHDAVYEQAQILEKFGWRARFVKPDANGIILPESVAAAVEEDTALVAVMAVNNETGAINPVKEILDAIKGSGIKKIPQLHCDAVQAFGKIAVTPGSLGANTMALTAHKLGGPRGIGVLYLQRPIKNIMQGGGQEFGNRAGTQNVAGAFAFAQAAAEATNSLAERQRHAHALMTRLLDGLGAIPGALPVPLSRTPLDGRYSPYIVSMAFPGLAGETMVRILDDGGISVSTGSACSSAKKERRVMDAMGLPGDISLAVVRVSTGPSTTAADIDLFLERAQAAYKRYKT